MGIEIYVKQELPAQTGTLGLIVLAMGIAAALGNPFWGRFADLSSRKVLVIGGLMGTATGTVALLPGVLPPSYQNSVTF